MISVEKASKIIDTHWPDWGEAALSIDHPSGGILAEVISGDRDYPPIHRVMMDGIAVSFDAFQAGRREFKIEGICAAGQPIQTLTHSDACIEIMTGAALPLHSDLVIQYEHLKIEGKVAQVVVEQERVRNEFTHRQGSDFKKGAPLLSAGQSLNGPRIGIAASVGGTSIRIQKKPKIKIISTGDELVPVSQVPLPHQVRRSNAHALMASLLSRGFTEVSLDHVSDHYEQLMRHYDQASKENDVLIYSGGVSKGKYDFLPEVWENSGVEKHFHEVSQRPGKPLWFGVDAKRNVAVFGLPGNPISSLVCLHRYFLKDTVRYARLTQDVRFSKNLTYFVPIKISYSEDGVTYAEPLEVKNSGEFSGLSESDGFIELPLEKSEFKKGESYRIYRWGIE